MLRIKLSDILRATLTVRSGNEGWIGVSATGDEYHVVVPVDRQIARGVMACNRPTDGTPFGGYSGWLYFRCPPYEDDQAGPSDEMLSQRSAASRNCRDLLTQLAAYEIAVELVGEDLQLSQDPTACDMLNEASAGAQPVPHKSSDAEKSVHVSTIQCPGCLKTWRNPGDLIRDVETTLDRYKADLDDFQRGRYVFSHACGGSIPVPVVRFARTRLRGKSLAGTHACPGPCYYETSLGPCSARCEGAIYRRLACKLVSKRRG
ncbi:hypothetical protein ACFL2Q_12920 [Thermodesulfobacteriota bacterium]